MKKISLLFIFCIMAAAGIAQDFGAVRYNLNYAFRTAEVISNPTKYTGTVFIPSMVWEPNCDYHVIKIGSNAFKDCFNLLTVVIPNTVTDIDDYAFENSSVNTLSIPNSVSRIGRRAFAECMKLSAITLPSSVSNIEREAFAQCLNLTQVTVEREQPAKIYASSFPDRARQTLFVPKGCKSAYEEAEYWREFMEIKE